MMNNNDANNNDLQADAAINHLINEELDNQNAQQNNILENPIDVQNQLMQQNQGNQDDDAQKKILRIISEQMRLVIEHYKWLIVTQFYFIFQLFLNILCYYIFINKNQDNLKYVFYIQIPLDILKIIQNTYYFHYNLIEQANQGLLIFPNQQMQVRPNTTEDMAQLMIKRMPPLQMLHPFIKQLQKVTLVLSSIIILTNIQELLNLNYTFIQITMILNLIRIINDLTIGINLKQIIGQIFSIKPLKQRMTKRRITYINNKTFVTFLLPLLYFYEMKTILDVYHILPSECSYLDIYFKIQFIVIWCIILELFINVLRTYIKLNEEKDIFERSLIGLSEIIFIVGILFSQAAIYLNYNSQCTSETPEFSLIRKCIHQFPLDLFIYYACFYYMLFNKNVISKSYQGIVSSELTEENICIICLEEFLIGQKFIRLKCHKDHIYHKSCILDWFENTKVCLKCKNKDI